MTFRATENGCRFVLNWVSGGLIRATNHFWFAKVGFDESGMEALAGAFWNGWNANNGIKDYISDDVRWTARLVDERTYDGPVVLNDPVNIDGEDVFEIDDWTVALVLSIYTGKRGRAYRGRLYFPGFGADVKAGGIYAQAAATAALVSLDAMHTATQLIGWTWGVRTSQVDHVQVNPAIITPLTTYSFRSLIGGNQRRRSLRP